MRCGGDGSSRECGTGGVVCGGVAGLGVLSVSGNVEAMVEAVRALGNLSRDAEARRSMHETRTDEAMVWPVSRLAYWGHARLGVELPVV